MKMNTNKLYEELPRVYMAINSSRKGADAEAVEIALVDQNGSLLLHTFVQPVELRSMEDHDLLDRPPFFTIYHDVVEIIGSAEVVANHAYYARQVLGNSAAWYGLDRPDYKTTCLQVMASKMDIYTDWDGMSNCCWFTARIDTNHLPDNAVGDAERIRLLHCYLLREQAKKNKKAMTREKCVGRKMALVPSNYRDFPYFGQSDRPKGYKTTSQLRIRDLPNYEFAGICCDTFGNRGYLFKPKYV